MTKINLPSKIVDHRIGNVSLRSSRDKLLVLYFFIKEFFDFYSI